MCTTESYSCSQTRSPPSSALFLSFSPIVAVSLLLSYPLPLEFNFALICISIYQQTEAWSATGSYLISIHWLGGEIFGTIFCRSHWCGIKFEFNSRMGEEGHGQLTLPSHHCLPRSRTKKRARFDPLLAGSFNELTRYLIFLERRARSPLLSACPARYRIPTTNAAVITVASSRLRLRVCVAYVMRMQRTLYHFFFSAIFENSDSRRSFCPLELYLFAGEARTRHSKSQPLFNLPALL